MSPLVTIHPSTTHLSIYLLSIYLPIIYLSIYGSTALLFDHGRFFQFLNPTHNR
jgi:hypothetical protein